MITPEKFEKILNKLPNEKTELSVLKKVELKINSIRLFFKRISKSRKTFTKKRKSTS